MRRIFAIIILFVLLLDNVFAQDISVAGISPEKPKTGDKVTITYYPSAKEAVIKNAVELNLEVLYVVENIPVACHITFYDSRDPVMKEYKMNKAGDKWEVSFIIDEPNTKILLFRFSSGDLLDENGGKSWYCLIYDEKGIPVENACSMLSEMYIYGFNHGLYDFSFESDMNRYKEEFANEQKNHPESAEGAPARWGEMYRSKETYNDNKPIIRKELDRLYERYKDNDRLLIKIVRWYKTLGDTARFEQIERSIKNEKPFGDYVYNQQLQSFKIDGEPAEQKKILKSIFDQKDLPEKQKIIFTRLRIAGYQRHNNYDSIFAYLNEPLVKHYLIYNNMLSSLIKADYKVKELLPYAKQNIARTNEGIVNEIPVYVSKRGWNKLSKEYLAKVIATYALACEKAGLPDEAYSNYVDAYKTKNDDPDLIEQYIAFLNKIKKYSEVIDVAKKAVEMSCYNSKIIDSYKAAYIGINGSEKGYEEIYERIKNNSYKNIAKELLNKPSPGFEYKYYDGKRISLSDLKGKIVILDFWGTWCGPCKESLPALQKMYDKYKNNNDVVFLAVNCSESWKGEERIKNVRKFVENLKYTFPVVIDESGGAYKDFEIDGIPAKFIIDKEGIIRFKDIGFSNADSMIDDMTLKIDMLLSGAYKQY